MPKTQQMRAFSGGYRKVVRAAGGDQLQHSGVGGDRDGQQDPGPAEPICEDDPEAERQTGDESGYGSAYRLTIEVAKANDFDGLASVQTAPDLGCSVRDEVGPPDEGEDDSEMLGLVERSQCQPERDQDELEQSPQVYRHQAVRPSQSSVHDAGL